MKIFTIILGTRFSVLMRLILRNGISLYPKHIARFLLLLVNSLISSALILAERKNYGRKTRETEISLPPIFIIGHWRTGSTLLHQFINLDPQFTTPTLVQTVIPDHLLFSTRYYFPILEKAVPQHRPMDNVKLSPQEPQEEEFALIRMGSQSPVEKLIFPSGEGYFLKGYEHYVPEGKKLEKWESNLLTFFRKITLQTGKQIVSKNPYHTKRMEELAKMFPGAKFIHITRDPLIVVPSTMKMWNIVAEQNSLKRGWNKPSIAETASVLREYLDHVEETRKKINNPFTELSFEELEKAPLDTLKKIYSSLDLRWSDEFETAVKNFLSANKGYQKNTYSLSEEEQRTIHKTIHPVQKHSRAGVISS